MQRQENFNEKLKLLPKKPGSYQMKDISGTIIYVGKAKNLYNRVNSYFKGAHDAKTTKLVSQIYDFDYIVTSTEKESLILEINLIKKYSPKYNIMLTDDKSYPYIALSNDKNPKVYYTRDLSKKNTKYFGPYPDSGSCKEVVELLNKIYPLRKCNKIPKKECLYYHIGQCLAPCIKSVDSTLYKEISSKITSFLKGNVKEEIKKYTQIMNEASENLDFEKAIEARNILKSLESIADRQKMNIDIDDTDIFNFYEANGKICIMIFHIRNHKMIERKGMLFDANSDSLDILKDVITQFYLSNNNPIPDEIIIPSDIDLVDEVLNGIKFIPQKGKKKEMLDLVKENAIERIEVLEKTEEVRKDRTINAVIKLGEMLGIKTPYVMEAFDNSNIQGESAVSAMVQFVGGEKKPSNYRKYKVKTVVGANDFETMKEVVMRRYLRLKKENSKYPDLIVIDGGKPQVKACKEALHHINVNINVLGLIKDDNHRTDALLFNDEVIKIDKRSNVFLLLESIQDEVHRYAITFHRSLHQKNQLRSKLDDIKGIGKVKRTLILELVSKKELTREKLQSLHFNEEQIEEILKLFI